MKEKISIAKLVFRRIAEIWKSIPVKEVGYTTIDRSIVEAKANNSKSDFQERGKRKHVNNIINKVNVTVEELESCFIK
jgi:hypothetical protein